MKTTTDKTEQNLVKTLGISNLRVTEEMHEKVMSSAKEDGRNLQHQVRWLINQGLLYRSTTKGDKKHE